MKLVTNKLKVCQTYVLDSQVLASEIFIASLLLQDYLVYLAKCSFLPKLNNELLQKNATYKQRITNLKNLVLIMVWRIACRLSAILLFLLA